jgi:hypothetical protein
MHGRYYNRIRTHPRLQCHVRLLVPVFTLVLRASAAKTKTIQHLALALSERRTVGTAGMVPSEDDGVETHVSWSVSCERSCPEDGWLVRAPALTKMVFLKGCQDSLIGIVELRRGELASEFRGSLAGSNRAVRKDFVTVLYAEASAPSVATRSS